MASILPKLNENEQSDSYVKRFFKESKISSFLHKYKKDCKNPITMHFGLLIDMLFLVFLHKNRTTY